MNRVSVVITVYNSEKTILDVLQSVIQQTALSEIKEIIIVDDGSSDKSLFIAKDYAAKYPFVEVYHQENAGVAAARNNLLSHVKGDYILFVDSSMIVPQSDMCREIGER